MLIHHGGLTFAVLGDAASPREAAWLRAREVAPETAVGAHLHLLARSPGTPAFALDAGSPPPMTWANGRLEVAFEGAHACVDVSRAVIELCRPPGSEAGLQAGLRVALACLLPGRHGLLLHSAVLGGSKGALLLHGPSGAGKSTIASLSPLPVLGDEHAAVLGPAPFRAVSLQHEPPACGSDKGLDVRGLLQLRKGAGFHLEALDSTAAVRSLLPALLVPPSAAPVWSCAMGVVSDLVHAVPTYRMSWRLDEPPWPHLAEAGLT